MLLIHNNLKCLASFADKKESGARWAVTGVQIESHDDGKRYVAAATDTKMLAIVEGPTLDASEYPLHGALKDAPNGGLKGLIPHEEWATIMADSLKASKKAGRYKPILNSVAIQLADGIVKETVKEDGSKETHITPGQAVMGWTNTEKSATPTVLTCEGRFPPYQDIVPRKKGLVRMAFDPEFFTRLGDALKQLKPLIDPETLRCEFDFYGTDKPVVCRMQNDETGQKITLLVMPLCSSSSSGARDISIDGFTMPDMLMDEGYWEKEAKRWREECEVRGKERDTAHDLLITTQKELGVLKHGAKDMEVHETFTASFTALTEQNAIAVKDLEQAVAQNARLSDEVTELDKAFIQQAEMMETLEKELQQCRLELNARNADVAMYRERTEWKEAEVIRD